jgi:hypothetical protein
MVLATPGLDEIFATPKEAGAFDKWDPRNICPLVAYLSAETCPFNGQVFSVLGGHVGLYAGWSIGQEVDGGRQWAVEELQQALAEFPAKLPVNRQRLV